MAQHQRARSGAWIVAAAATVIVVLGTLSRTARPEDEPAYSVAVESSDRDRTVLRITVHQDVDFRDLHLLPYESPPLHPPRQLPGVRQKSLVLGEAVFELVPSAEVGILSFLKKPDQPRTGKGTYLVELDWTYPDGAKTDYIGIQVVLTTNRDATRWAPADIVGGRSVRVDPMNRIPSVVSTPAVAPQAAAGTSIKTDYYTLAAPAGLQADAVAMRSALDGGIEALRKHFASMDIGGLLSQAVVTIQLHARSTDKAAPGLATTETGTTDGSVKTYYARMHLLAPSAHPADALTSAGEPMGLAYCERIIIHEYSTVLLDLVCRGKERGWRFFDAPKWFIQGYEEYLGLTCGDAQAGKVTLGKYVAMIKAHPEWVSFDFGLDVTRPYVAGPVLIHFLYERYGGAKVQAVLTSLEPTFGRAMRTSLGIGVEQVGADWGAWLEAAEPPP